MASQPTVAVSEFRRQALIAETMITTERVRIVRGAANAREAFFPGYDSMPTGYCAQMARYYA
jgi:hypothetical protein